MNRRAVLAMITLLMLPVLVIASPDLDSLRARLGSVRKLVHKTSPAEEREIGRDAAATLLGASHLVMDDAAERYVNQVGTWVALQTKEGAKVDWRFGILDDPDVDAYAAPGGFVFVTEGLMLELHDEAELAGVLGHEIAHVMRHHHLKALRKDSRLGFLTEKVVTNLSQDDPQRRERLEKVAAGAKTLYTKGLDKRDEFEADRVGVVLAARAGYDPYGLVAVLQTLDALDPGSRALELLLKSHPAPAARLAALDEAFGGRDLLKGTGVEARDRFLAATAGLRSR